MKQQISRYQNSPTWKREYNRLTMHGTDNITAARKADAMMDAQLASLKAKFAAARKAAR